MLKWRESTNKLNINRLPRMKLMVSSMFIINPSSKNTSISRALLIMLLNSCSVSFFVMLTFPNTNPSTATLSIPLPPTCSLRLYASSALVMSASGLRFSLYMCFITLKNTMPTRIPAPMPMSIWVMNSFVYAPTMSMPFIPVVRRSTSMRGISIVMGVLNIASISRYSMTLFVFFFIIENSVAGSVAAIIIANVAPISAPLISNV